MLCMPLKILTDLSIRHFFTMANKQYFNKKSWIHVVLKRNVKYEKY